MIPPLPDETQTIVDTQRGKFRDALAELTNGDMSINDAADRVFDAIYNTFDDAVMPPTWHWMTDFLMFLDKERRT